jgi:hypothetical protein
VDRLKELFCYHPLTGLYVRLIRRGNKMPGDIAGKIDKEGYVVISIDGRYYYGHRLSWLYMTGDWPTHDVDHEDTNRSNNVWTNLRHATNAENAHNSKTPTHNTSGIKGVHWHRKACKWVAMISVNRKSMYLGLFSHIDDARIAVEQARIKYHGEFANHGTKE